ncbi:hypothetical protein YBT1518_p00040 (plasmid) [Bacillus thuringiensis YBT-1518]|uniref:Uncharacterized protein n=1 Tax=Bacillus thuringiensis YBT-1518 TaxID=529122 RepID=A0A9W3K844_BACTU|nr:hypothetical protein YBT1518_p00040 [Bacillus thuringiensis YBT-1518]
MNVGLISCVLIDSTALRSSLYDILKRNGENLLAMVGIRDIKLMSVLHQKVLYCRMHLQPQMYMIVK